MATLINPTIKPKLHNLEFCKTNHDWHLRIFLHTIRIKSNFFFSIFSLFFKNSQTFGTWSHWQRIRPDSWTLRGNVFQARNYCGLWWHSISLGPNARIGLYSSWDQKGLIAWQFILGQLLLRQSILKNWCKNSNFDLFWPNKFQF